MLVLTRKIQQQIDIGEDIKITVVKISESQVRIGIECPDEITITRSELKEKTDESSQGSKRQGK